MRVALVNPRWSYEGSVYFGCREPHFAIELACCRALLAEAGHEPLFIDAHLHDLAFDEIRASLERFAPQLTVVTTAPTLLFWRCPPPELRIPKQLIDAIRDRAGTLVAVGPHASTTPNATLQKLKIERALRGECEQLVVELAGGRDADGEAQLDMEKLPALRWSDEDIRRHRHHHHRFDVQPDRPGCELEVSRGQRRRPLAVVLEELDALIAQGVEYVYFIDEIFAPDRALLEALREREVVFGVRLRIAEWSPELLELLGRAGCRSIEAGVERLRDPAKGTDEHSELLISAKKLVPFVQANLLDGGEPAEPAQIEKIEKWRKLLASRGVWADKPVPPFPYPGSSDYQQRWGAPDDRAWERAHEHYLAQRQELSEMKDARPAPLAELENG
jgi:B12-binding domain/radical SAM domain protein of rhizo-twelve system